jgi:hypothetical protein
MWNYEREGQEQQKKGGEMKRNNNMKSNLKR